MTPRLDAGAAPTRAAGRRGRAGVTLIELVISIVVISVAVAGILLAMNVVVVHSADPMIERQASAIAESYLEEILSRAYLDPDDGTVCPAPEAAGRSAYDNVCDYQSLSDAGARNQQDAPVAGLEPYQVAVAVDTGATLNGLTGSAQVLRVDVTVTRGSLVNLTLSGYRTP